MNSGCFGWWFIFVVHHRNGMMICTFQMDCSRLCENQEELQYISWFSYSRPLVQIRWVFVLELHDWFVFLMLGIFVQHWMTHGILDEDKDGPSFEPWLLDVSKNVQKGYTTPGPMFFRGVFLFGGASQLCSLVSKVINIHHFIGKVMIESIH